MTEHGATTTTRRTRRRAGVIAVVGALVAVLVPAGAPAEQASAPAIAAAGELDAGAYHSCAVLASHSLRCWGFSGDGQLGYANRDTIGDGEAPGAVGPVNVGVGRTVTAVATGDFHTCALLDDRSVRCWGYGFDGELGYGNRNNVGDDEPPSAAGPVVLGAPATAISAGGRHTCALLDDGSVRCWGQGTYGQLGYGTTNNIGDGGRGQSDTPASAGPVAVGGNVTAISAGGRHTCALLAGGSVRCWGLNSSGQLGYGTTSFVSSPADVGAVSLGSGRTATAISAGEAHTCALLDDGSVRCWGFGADGELGYGTTANVGDDELPSAAGPVDLGARQAIAISAGSAHTCALLDDGAVRCWGSGADGRLGGASTTTIGDDEPPLAVPAIDIGAGRAGVAVTAGQAHTCARLDDGGVRCWGVAVAGRLGVCAAAPIGDDELPGSVAAIDLEASGAPCAAAGPAAPPPVGAEPVTPPLGGAPLAAAATPPASAAGDPFANEARRAALLRGCLAKAARLPRRRRAAARRACLTRHGRTPGRVRALTARAASRTEIVLSFAAPGTDGARPPAARTFVVRQARRPIRGARGFAQAGTLCGGGCTFSGIRVGTRLELRVTNLRPRTTYYYAVAARDNVSRRLGPRSYTVRATTR